MFKQDHMERIKVYFEYLMKLTNNLQTKVTNRLFYCSVQVEGKLTPTLGSR